MSYDLILVCTCLQTHENENIFHMFLQSLLQEKLFVRITLMSCTKTKAHDDSKRYKKVQEIILHPRQSPGLCVKSMLLKNAVLSFTLEDYVWIKP